MFGQSPLRFHLTIIVILCAVGMGVAWWFLHHNQLKWQHWLAMWMLVINIITFGYYAFDKLLSTRVLVVWYRVPETVLHTLNFLGGSPAALIAMSIFRHKTIKQSFRIVFWAIVIVQMALAAYIVKSVW
jgi:uncharacterized membrane protein YsdA (DUF1294 family)